MCGESVSVTEQKRVCHSVRAVDPLGVAGMLSARSEALIATIKATRRKTVSPPDSHLYHSSLYLIKPVKK